MRGSAAATPWNREWGGVVNRCVVALVRRAARPPGAKPVDHVLHGWLAQDVTPAIRPPHQDLTFLSPLSPERADRLVRFLADDLVGTVLDLGCGWGELLLQVLASAPETHGTGIDTDGVSLAHGRDLARHRGLDDRVTLLDGDARTQAPPHVDAVICIGASQIWGPPVEAKQPLDYGSALTALRATVERGARVVYGEGIWSRPPTPEAVAPLSGRLDELVALPDLVELAVTHGLAPVAVHEASLGEWDVFESGYAAGWAVWLAEHNPHHPGAAEVRLRVARQRAGYLGGYRGVYGMAYLELLAV